MFEICEKLRGARSKKGRQVDAYDEMAGLFLVGVPCVGGVVGGTILQLGMRASGLGIGARVGVELGLIGVGAYGIYANPMGSAQKCENWDKCMGFGALIASGLVAMSEGILINLSHADNTFISCAGILALYGLKRLCGYYYRIGG